MGVWESGCMIYDFAKGSLWPRLCCKQKGYRAGKKSEPELHSTGCRRTSPTQDPSSLTTPILFFLYTLLPCSAQRRLIRKDDLDGSWRQPPPLGKSFLNSMCSLENAAGDPNDMSVSSIKCKRFSSLLTDSELFIRNHTEKVNCGRT